jgi:YesN/AraC family two-component response regulator
VTAVTHLVDEIAHTDNGAEQQRGTPDPAAYVLIVDDEPVVRNFLKRCLEASGYPVKQAGNADQALELMAATPASVVLCDIRMPGHDGLWLAERLRANWPRTAIIMATAVDDHDTVRQSSALGVADYLIKPIAAEHLLHVVGRADRARTERELAAKRGALSVHERDMTDGRLEHGIEAEYTLEHPVKCSACGERITTLRAVRLIRSRVNFTSTLPRRGRIVTCPRCLAIMPVELGSF